MDKVTSQQWDEKREFILKFNPTNPGEAFHSSRMVYADYCNDQANACAADGFPLIAEDIRQARDIASPDYRTIARDTGRIVLGTYVTTNTRDRLFDSTPDIARFGP